MNRIVKDLITKYATENTSDIQVNEWLKDILTKFAADLLNINSEEEHCIPPNTGLCWDDFNF